MFCAATFISLSNLFAEASANASEIDPLPIIVPVLTSLTMPIICSNFGMFTKYVVGKKHISAQDFTFGYALVSKGLFVIVSIFYF